MTTDNNVHNAVDQALDGRSLEWAAKWIEDSLKGEPDQRVREFGKNMAMTLRAATPFTEPQKCVECHHDSSTWNPVTALCEFDPDPSDENADFCGCKCTLPAAAQGEDADDLSEGPTGCLDDGDELSRALRRITPERLNEILDEQLGRRGSDAPLLTPEETDLVIGAIPLQALPSDDAEKQAREIVELEPCDQTKK